jgi:hypothetical protein
MILYCLFVKLLALTLLDDERPLKTFADTATKPITILLTDKPCLAIDNLKSALGTSNDTGSTTITFILINPDNLS